MIENLKTKYTIYFARRWLEEVLTQCRRMEGFLNHLRRDAHLNSRYTSLDFDVKKYTIEKFLRIEVNIAKEFDKEEFYEHWQHLGDMIHNLAIKHGDQFNRQYERTKTERAL